MTTLVPPQEKKIISIDENGIATIVKSAGEIVLNGTEMLTEEMKEELKNDPYMQDATPLKFGGFAHTTVKELARDNWTRNGEKKQFRNFLQLRRKWMEECIPIEKEALKNKLLVKYGTTDPKVYEHMLNEGMKGNARLNILTRRGIVYSSVEELKQFSAQRAQSFEGVKK